MRYPVLAILIIAAVSTCIPFGCKDASIGQPCQFIWPENDAGGATPCTSLPRCHPLLQAPTGGVPAAACPGDCVENSTIQCEELICIATEVPDDYQQMNGQCTLEDDPTDAQCPKKLTGCMGYCTKMCDSDDDCPKNYTCSSTAPYPDLPCGDEDEANWGTVCTADCIHSGDQIPGQASGTTCPSDANICKNSTNSTYDTCCLCICSKICPFVRQKVCRKDTYDEKMFPKGKLSEDDFNALDQCYQGSGQ